MGKKILVVDDSRTIRQLLPVFSLSIFTFLNCKVENNPKVSAGLNVRSSTLTLAGSCKISTSGGGQTYNTCREYRFSPGKSFDAKTECIQLSSNEGAATVTSNWVSEKACEVDQFACMEKFSWGGTINQLPFSCNSIAGSIDVTGRTQKVSPTTASADSFDCLNLPEVAMDCGPPTAFDSISDSRDADSVRLITDRKLGNPFCLKANPSYRSQDKVFESVQLSLWPTKPANDNGQNMLGFTALEINVRENDFNKKMKPLGPLKYVLNPMEISLDDLGVVLFQTGGTAAESFQPGSFVQVDKTQNGASVKLKLKARLPTKNNVLDICAEFTLPSQRPR
jgi:hypothetical protein